MDTNLGLIQSSGNKRKANIMAVNLSPPNNILPVSGIQLSSAYAGVRSTEKDDVVLIEVPAESSIAATFTQNAFCAAPVVVAKAHLSEIESNSGAPTPSYLLINAGNANAGTGDKGIQAAKHLCTRVAEHAQVSPNAVLPFSTGVIGEYLPIEKIEAVLPSLFDRLDLDNWVTASEAITTTDTVAKAYSERVELPCGTPITITGMSKGAGMIQPDMATMLAYIATDANIDQPLLEGLIKECVAQSFNAITVDSDTSTNDACVLMASCQAEHECLTLSSADEKNMQYPAYLAVKNALLNVFKTLAQAIVRDAEGATKFVSVCVEQGADIQECKDVAYTIAHSPLVKTALFASDPNWGRILACVGRAGLKELNVNDITILLDDVVIVSAGQRAESYTEAAGAQVMSQDEITITVRLARGEVSHTVWTCDFSYDYVRINAEYRT